MKNTSEEAHLIHLLEYYVLHVINELSEERQVAVKRLEPQLQKVFGHACWLAVLKRYVRWTDGHEIEVRQVWDKYRSWARQRGVSPDPWVFASSYVDQNFVSALDFNQVLD